MKSSADVIIIGAGLTGLTAANYLRQAGKSVLLLEASDRPGGRIKTDRVNGFLCDRGFQVLLTEYPETKALLDYDALDLQAFLPGALVLSEDGMQEILDPTRKPSGLFKTLLSDVGTIRDKFMMLALVARLRRKSVDEIFTGEELSTLEIIQQYGFGEIMLRKFFQPFMAGIFLESSLTTSRRMFDFVFKMFSSGDTSIPRLGMEEIPKQLASRLPEESILSGQKVVAIDGQQVKTAKGNKYSAPQILLATEANDFLQNLDDKVKLSRQSVTNLYFSTPRLPIYKPLIALNASKSKWVNNLCVMDLVSDAYAPEGQHLVSVSVSGLQEASDEVLVREAVDELSRWFGQPVKDWKHLTTYRIDYALPNQDRVQNDIQPAKMRIREGLYVAGDHQLNGSINAAMKVGRVAAGLLQTDSAPVTESV
jgi:phytoene dehydrogenase-like protein